MMSTEQHSGGPQINPQMMAQMRQNSALPGTENFPPQLAAGIAQLNRVKPEAAQAMIRDLNKLQQYKPEAAAALMRADAGILLNAYVMKHENRSSEAWNKLLALSEMREPPQPLSWLGRQRVRLKSMLEKGATSALIMGGFTAAFKGGAHALDFKSAAGTDYTAEARASNDALIGARDIIRGGGTIPGWDTMTEDQRNHILNAQELRPIDPLNSIMKQSGMAALAGGGLGATFAGIGSEGLVTQAVRENEMERAVWQMMHSGAQDARGGADVAQGGPEIERPNVPNRGGAPARGLFS